ncbi:sensor domain-containing protein [Microtetraspora sp. AC03309]|uniref:sensor histidine kinase n=1 Tax=Microtetraspora sp. AC03309 TaxID=2779376 RepID=UPI001E28B9DB|nr:histidine kinase [Microtetraspora sp. AC03309]MCC5581492.1 sensor domain-containing protein [Microtetraspora sp. AC03309]
MRARTALEALTRHPLSFLRSRWPWRSLAYLLSSAVLGVTVAVVAVSISFLGFVPLMVAAGLAAAALVVPSVARFERWRLRLVDRTPLASAPDRLWREVGLALVSLLVLWWIDLVVVCFTIGGPVVLILSPAVQPVEADGALAAALTASVAGSLLLPVAAYALSVWAGARGAMIRALLAPREADLAEVLRSRARLVDGFETERRRIERDLHDGAQQRLVALSMRLGLIQLDVPPDAPIVAQLAQAQEEARRALAELRELIRGVHPQVLSDRGLAAAVRDVAGRSPVPVDVNVSLPRRLPEPVEVAAYYVVSEALANIAKHSRAVRARIHGRLVDDVLVMEIHDDGVGGADPAGGTGLTGLADRVAVADGRLSLSSPTGGPTTIRVEIPCA